MLGLAACFQTAVFPVCLSGSLFQIAVFRFCRGGSSFRAAGFQFREALIGFDLVCFDLVKALTGLLFKFSQFALKIIFIIRRSIADYLFAFCESQLYRCM
jgi:hypothetical protein